MRGEKQCQIIIGMTVITIMSMLMIIIMVIQDSIITETAANSRS